MNRLAVCSVAANGSRMGNELLLWLDSDVVVVVYAVGVVETTTRRRLGVKEEENFCC